MDEKETISLYSIKREYSISSPLTLQILKDFNSKKLGKDITTFTLSFNSTDDIEVWDNQNIDDFTILLDKYNEEVTEVDDIAFLNVTNKKNQTEFNIYSPVCLLKELERLSFAHFYNTFNKIINNSKTIKIHANEKIDFKSTLFNSLDSSESIDETQRNSILENWSYFTNVQGINDPRLLPTDFVDSTAHFSSDSMKEIFHILSNFSNLLSLIFLSDVVLIKDNLITIKINSYNRLSIQINYKKTIFKNSEPLLKIFKWVYMDRSSFLADDKIVFAKDQLSRKLYFSPESNEVKIDDSTLPSILSMHRIYLKENANQYIETTNTVAELISKISIQQKEIQNSIVNSLKTSSSVFLSLFISLLVFNTLSSNAKHVFEFQNYNLTLLFGLLSLIAMLVARYQVNRDLENVIKNFNDTKKIYTHLFSEEDLKILFNIEYTNQFKTNVEKSRDFYSYIWFAEVILVLVVVSMLTFIS